MISVDSLQKEIRDLEKQQQLLLEEKKLALQQALPINEKINSMMSLAKSLKAERDEFNALVRKSKENRKKVGVEIRNLIAGIRELSGQQKDYFGLDNTRIIGSTLNDMEWKLQTEVTDPKEEETLSKQIESLSSMFKGAKKRDKLSVEVNGLRGELDELGKEFNAHHMLVLDYARQSEERHQKLIEISGKIDQLKAERKSFDEKLDALSGQSKKIIEEVNQKKAELERIEGEVEAEKKKEADEKLRQREAAVRKKLKKGEKLTTEDFIIFQGQEKDS